MASVVCCDPMESTSPRFTVHQDSRASVGGLSSLDGSSPTLQPLSCLHCDFQCSLHTEMTQHRWELHPLLMRRKQHLMTSLIRQRQQSETLSDVTVDSDVGESTSDQEQTNIAPTATSLEKMQKTRSLDDISTIRRHELRSDVERTSSQTAKLSIVDNTSSADRQYNCHVNAQDSNPVSETSQSEVSDGLHTLAETALNATSMSSLPPNPVCGMDAKLGGAAQDNNQPSADSGHGVRYSYAGVFLPPDKKPPSLMNSEGHVNMELNDPRYLLQAELQHHIAGNPNAVIYNNLQRSIALSTPNVGNLFGNYLSQQHFVPPMLNYAFGYPYLHAYPPHWHAACTGGPNITPPVTKCDTRATGNNNLSTLSDVATRILTNNATQYAHRSQSAQTSQTGQISSDTKEATQHTCPVQPKYIGDGITKPPPAPAHTNLQPATKPAEKSKIPHTFQPASLSHHLKANAVMSDDHMKSLEEALRNTDCCDPNERSSVLPIRGNDGKWNMVRTKRIGGAWLVQLPGNNKPSVFLTKTGQTNDNKVKHQGGSAPPSTNEGSLHDLLRRTRYPIPVPGTSVCKRLMAHEAANNQKRPKFEKPLERVSDFKQTMSSDAIKSLLLQKAASA